MSKKIDNLLKSFLIETDKEEQESREVVWEEEPVSFEEFITSKEMMNFPPYSDRQLDAMNYLLGTEPKNTFNNGIALAVLCWGKGCLAKETILENALTREKYTIEELYKQQKSIPIFCYDEKTKKQTIEMATAPWIAGKGSIFEVKTESGKCINVFEHHQFYTKNGWKKLSELSIGDEIFNFVHEFEKIKSITYLREDEYYDLEVNKYHNYLAHGLYNHNSGKDTISCHAVLYCVYLLLCCKNPYRLFRGIDASSYMDIVNVAYNKTQSTQVFFTKLVESVKNWKWLRNKYRYIESGKSKKLDKKYENEEIVNIKAEEIIFPKHIRAVSRCSQQNAAEGLNVLLYILDEFSAFSDKNNKSNAMEMFNTLRTSSITRFGNQAKGFIISFPRYQGDPILKLAEMYKDDLNVYVDIASTFEVKPKSCFCDKWVEWEGHLIPEDFLTDFIKDPENSKAKFLCQPPEMSDPFFTDTQRIDNSIDKEKKQLFEVRDKFIKDPINGIELIGKEIIGKNYNAPNVVYCIGGDIGYTNDLTAVTIWHKETLNTADGQEYSRIIQDCLITWKPNKDKKIQVDVANIEEVISDIIFKWKLPISGFYFDHYNTAALMQNFRKRGVNAQAYKLTVQDFYDIRTKLYSGNISFLDVEEQTREMKRLINTKQGKPDHISGDHDDMFRANCLAITMLDGDFKNRPIVMNDDGLFINKKLTIENGQIDNEFEGELVKGRFHNGGGVDFENFGFDDNYGDDDITI